MDSERVCNFVVEHVSAAHGRRALIARSKSSPARAGLATPALTLKHYNIKGVREDSHLGLLGWLEGRYPLELRENIPTPREMLEVQCEGRRFVSLLDAKVFEGKFGRHAGPYEFLLHDLEHAHKFFGGEFHGQVRFFNLLKSALDQNAFSVFDEDPQFMRELDYLMADMNSHPVHLLKYLKAIVLSAFQREGASNDGRLSKWSENLFDLWQMPQDVWNSAMRINYPKEETDFDRLAVSRFFTRGLA